MFSHIKIECIGKQLNDSILHSSPFFRIPNRYWVAEIRGIGSKYKFSRAFLRPKYDYKDSNSRGTRGVYANYFIEHYKIYEVSSPQSWRSIDRYFCTFDENGKHRLTEEQVIECLKNNH